MALECSLYEKTDSIATITLNRPNALNALNKKLWCEILESLNRAENDKEIRAVIITGSSKAFSAGDDIKEVANIEHGEEMEIFFKKFAFPTIKKIIQLTKPVIAAVNGLAYGGGCEIVMLCDLAVASENATFAVPEALIGAIPPVASVLGSHIMGKLNISMMMMTGKPVTANEAKQMGLVNIVVPKEELLETAEKLAKSTMRIAPSSVGVMKKLLYQRFSQKELEQSAEELIKILQTDEGKEGHRAFIEKRRPKWVPSEFID